MKLPPLRLTCPEHTGWGWLLCSHEELRHPVIGFALMMVGAALVALALSELL